MKLFLLTITTLTLLACSSESSPTTTSTEKKATEETNDVSEKTFSSSSTKEKEEQTGTPEKQSSTTPTNSSTVLHSSSSITIEADTVADTTAATEDFDFDGGAYTTKIGKTTLETQFYKDSISSKGNYQTNHYQGDFNSPTNFAFEGGDFFIKGNKLTLDPDRCTIEDSNGIFQEHDGADCFEKIYVATINSTKDTLVLVDASDTNTRIIYTKIILN